MRLPVGSEGVCVTSPRVDIALAAALSTAASMTCSLNPLSSKILRQCHLGWRTFGGLPVKEREGEATVTIDCATRSCLTVVSCDGRRSPEASLIGNQTSIAKGWGPLEAFRYHHRLPCLGQRCEEHCFIQLFIMRPIDSKGYFLSKHCSLSWQSIIRYNHGHGSNCLALMSRVILLRWLVN